jgi:hypothetical protein
MRRRRCLTQHGAVASSWRRPPSTRMAVVNSIRPDIASASGVRPPCAISRNAFFPFSTSTLVPLTLWETGPNYQCQQSPVDRGEAAPGVPTKLRVRGNKALPKWAGKASACAHFLNRFCEGSRKSKRVGEDNGSDRRHRLRLLGTQYRQEFVRS